MKWKDLAQPAITVAAVTTTVIACAATAAVGCAIAGAAIGGAAGAASYSADVASSGDDFDGGSFAASAGIGAALGLIPGVGKGLGTLVKNSRPGSTLLPNLPSTAPKPQGLGSTGRTSPQNLKEQIAMTEVRSAPCGRPVSRITMTDSRWPASEGWEKMQQMVNGVNIHYVRNINSGAVDDFKFVTR